MCTLKDGKGAAVKDKLSRKMDHCGNRGKNPGLTNSGRLGMIFEKDKGVLILRGKSALFGYL